MLILVDKPKGITSHDVVDRIRKVTHERRVGHAGTLDPNATGLLIVGVGRESTKKLGEITKNTKKTYFAEVTLGEERDTDDVEGKVTKKIEIADPPKKEKVKEVLDGLIGEQEQVPPPYSAIKMNGKKAYELARSGKKVVVEPRNITVYSAKLLSYQFPIISIEFEVSSGTYIRALARDLGRALSSGAYLSNLRRTKIGDYSIEDAKSLDELSV